MDGGKARGRGNCRLSEEPDEPHGGQRGRGAVEKLKPWPALSAREKAGRIRDLELRLLRSRKRTRLLIKRALRERRRERGNDQ